MRSLVTGGAGFIGSHLADALVATGDDVLVLDDLSTGSIGNLDAITDRIQFIAGSVLDVDLVDSAVAGVDRVFHLAGMVGVELVTRRPVASTWSNVAGTEHVAAAAHRAGATLLFTSSSEVYGMGARFPQREQDERTLGPTRELRWGYAEAKALGETLVLGRVTEGLQGVVVRLFNTVGPRQVATHGMVLPRFVRAALDGDDIRVYGDGTQTRTFCSVSDVVPALIALTEQPAAVGEVVNLGSDREITVLELAELVCRVLDSPSTVRLVEPSDSSGRNIDFSRRLPDITIARELVGFRAKTELADVIRAVADELE